MLSGIGRISWRDRDLLSLAFMPLANDLKATGSPPAYEGTFQEGIAKKFEPPRENTPRALCFNDKFKNHLGTMPIKLPYLHRTSAWLITASWLSAT